MRCPLSPILEANIEDLSSCAADVLPDEISTIVHTARQIEIVLVQRGRSCESTQGGLAAQMSSSHINPIPKDLNASRTGFNQANEQGTIEAGNQTPFSFNESVIHNQNAESTLPVSAALVQHAMDTRPFGGQMHIEKPIWLTNVGQEKQHHDYTESSDLYKRRFISSVMARLEGLKYVAPYSFVMGGRKAGRPKAHQLAASLPRQKRRHRKLQKRRRNQPLSHVLQQCDF